ncbi:hypothetical protein [uncultured Chitinophaga sp.]|jgi:hypothetical protein|uniref:hypothetical protein n=1 Tax=uncultured Chitinophaga sp. TaxID=339340 RepID=UPI00260DB724|nr:hypothetical protein [uncultured Chitinophaga sp.]
MKRALTWRHLKALNQLYVDKRTDAKITDNGYITNVLMMQKRFLKFKSGNNKILEAAPKYFTFYGENFKQDFEQYAQFLQTANLEDDARRRYTEEDIRTLMFIAEQKEELVKNLTTIRTFSVNIFKGMGSKYLENKPGLKSAVCKILGIIDFPEKDPKNLQWRFVADCISPKAIVLCENLDRLKNPWKAREANLELWYVGGNNIGIIEFIDPDKLVLPTYYCCDWDFDGLSIYSRIKHKIKSKGHELNLLIPDAYDVSLPIDSPHHNSRWNFNTALSGLKHEDFSVEAIDLIKRLIQDDKWIEEESLDLIQLLQHSYQVP